MNGEDPKERPDYINAIINGLERYNPEAVNTLEAYLQDQCEQGFCDANANRTLLKLFQLNPDRIKDEAITNILVKAMTQFPSPQFSLAMHLLPGPVAMGMRKPPEGAPPVAESELHEAVHKLRELNAHLEAARYAKFWATFDSDDLYADLTADVSGFEELMRVRIAQLVGQAYREVGLDKLELWLGIRGGEAETRRFVEGTCKWTVRDAKDGEESPVAIVPLNPDNEAKKAEIREDVSFDMFSRVVRRSWEEQAL